jgi:hypothetical protein
MPPPVLSLSKGRRKATPERPPRKSCDLEHKHKLWYNNSLLSEV